jgi:uncharacterized Fe-S cluster-containing MiaB family protein
MGLETTHPQVLSRLNKGMTVEDFAQAARFLKEEGIATRAFVLLQPPFLPADESVEWCLRSIAFAFDAGVRCCSVIPTRTGNGIMELLEVEGAFRRPGLNALESVLETALGWRRGRVFADLWDAEQFGTCRDCTAGRMERLAKMNAVQRPIPPVSCNVCGMSVGESVERIPAGGGS